MFNSRNQIESTTVLTSQRRVTVLGEVNYPMGTVTVGSVQAVLHGTTFEAPNVPVAMGSNVLTAIYEGPGFTNTGHIATATVGMVISNRLYEHDTNGNLLVLRSLGEGGTNDSVFAYAWDAANQLTNIVRLADDQRVLSMRYDALGRRVEVTRADDSIERYVYIPGTFMVLAVLDGDNEIKELYTHGPDLSGTLGGAGGIGGILADFRPQTSDLRALHSDAMGNIVLVTDETGAEAARYRYTPFGREIQREGDYEARYRFSSKEFDPETGLVYYGFRHYSPALGRWINRDPIGEYGGLNVYEIVKNNPLNHSDFLGLLVDVWVCRRPLNLGPLRRVNAGIVSHSFLSSVNLHGARVNIGDDPPAEPSNTFSFDWRDNPRGFETFPNNFSYTIRCRRVSRLVREGGSYEACCRRHRNDDFKRTCCEQDDPAITRCLLDQIAWPTACSPIDYHAGWNNCHRNADKLLKHCCAK